MLLIYGVAHTSPARKGRKSYAGVRTPSGTTEREVAKRAGATLTYKLLNEGWRVIHLEGRTQEQIRRANDLRDECLEHNEDFVALQIHMNGPVATWPDEMKRKARGSLVFARRESQDAMDLGYDLLNVCDKTIKQDGKRRKVYAIPDDRYQRLIWVKYI